MEASVSTRKLAEHRLKEKLVNRTAPTRGLGEPGPDSSFSRLVDAWLGDLDFEGKLAPSTRALYERNMHQLVLPAFEHFSPREITVSRVDQFIKTLATTKSHSAAEQARTVLSLAFGLAVRYDAIARNPVRLHKPPSQAKALTVEEINAIRDAARSWRRGAGFVGPPPDGQLEQITPLPFRNELHYASGVFERVDWSKRGEYMQRKHGIPPEWQTTRSAMPTGFSSSRTTTAQAATASGSSDTRPSRTTSSRSSC